MVFVKHPDEAKDLYADVAHDIKRRQALQNSPRWLAVQQLYRQHTAEQFLGDASENFVRSNKKT